MKAGVAEGFDFQAADGPEMADVAGEQGFIVFERGGGDEGVDFGSRDGDVESGAAATSILFPSA